MNTKTIRTIASFSMAIAVAAGAMGAHYLKSVLEVKQLNSFETGVRYLIIHCLALLIISNVNNYQNNKSLQRASLVMCLGVLLFSGSIFLLSTRSLTGLESIDILVFATPLGGVLLIISWIIMALYFMKEKTNNESC